MSTFSLPVQNNLPEPPIKKEYPVTITGGEGGIVFPESHTIAFGKTETIMVTPNTGYYLESFSCTNGYKNNAKIDSTSSEAQTITINNNNGNTGSTCTATFAVAHYKIEYELDGGTIEGEYPENYTIEDEEITLPTPTKTGYNFLGWSGSNGTVQAIVTIPKGSTGNKSYTANWEAKKYTVTINSNTGGITSVSNLTVNYGETGTFTVTPSNGYYLSSVSCTNGYTTNAQTGATQISSQEITISNNSKDTNSTCTISFDDSLISYLTDLATRDTTNLAYDGTTDNNLRYIGKNPNNYITFNGETWRIIGIMNNVEDSSGAKGSHVKIIRNESIGSYSWNGDNVNNWMHPTKSLSKILNEGPYWNQKSGTCYQYNNSSSSVTSTTCGFYSTGLISDAKSMISNIKWNLGGYNTYRASTSTFYTAEKGTTVYGSHATTWTGYVGLMYPSDYGYAVGGVDRSACLSSNLYNYDSQSCYGNDWLYSSGFQMTLTTASHNSSDVFSVSSNGGLVSYYSHSSGNIRPVVYLNSNIIKTGGSGIKSDPYTIASPSENLVDYLTRLSKVDTNNLVYDETTDSNLRYIGGSPSNYVKFNDELWRIIGVMNNVEDSSGNKASRIKLIRSSSIKTLEWDANRTGDWKNSTLQNTLNSGPYWNRMKGTCYERGCEYNVCGAQPIDCDFSSNGLSNESKTMISSTKWNIGGVSVGESIDDKSVVEIYSEERGTNIYLSNATEWVGYVGLIYASDFGYAFGGNSYRDRSACLAKFDMCSEEGNWMHQDSNNRWTLTTRVSDGYPYDTPYTNCYGNGCSGRIGGFSNADQKNNVYPVVYLNTNIQKTGGIGTSANPFTIE